MTLYAMSRRRMAESGNPHQWGDAYPPRTMVKADCSAGCLYVLEREGKVCGVFALIGTGEPDYAVIDGAWRRQTAYGTIHRVGSDGSGGVFREILAFCRARYDYLRIDTHQDNHIMQHVLAKNGFRPSGVIHLCSTGEPRLAYEWFDGIA